MKWFKRILAIKVSLVVAVLAVCLVSAYDQIKVKNVEVKYLKQQVEQSRKLNERLMGMEVKNLKHLKVTLTSYNPVKRQTDSTPLIGANGKMVTPGGIAISRDLTRKYGIKLGDKVAIENLGTFTVIDYTNSRFRKRVDLLSFIPAWSKEFGVKKGVTIYFNKN